MLSLRRQNGDTIVEVMIAIAIISLVLVGAYTVTNRNVLALQANEERVQGQHIAEGQIEALRANSGISGDDTCFQNGVAKVADPAHPDNPTLNPCDARQAGSGADYQVKITQNSQHVYVIVVAWTSIDGGPENGSNITMYYRVQ